MKKPMEFFKLDKEAQLLDSKLFILKGALGIATAYIVTKSNSILSKDMISVLFGLMLTLETVNIAGIKSGVEQVYASIIGATCTGVIIFFFGINPVTIGFSMALTLYVCLKINWKSISPVAIFTSIYMTQYVQKDVLGNDSVFLTFRLRILALGAGVIIAILYNFIFSLLYYRKMAYKRLNFLIYEVMNNLDNTIKYIEENNVEGFRKLRGEIFHSFGDIQWIYSQFNHLEKEFKWIIFRKVKYKEILSKLMKSILSIENISHFIDDIIEVLLHKESLNEYSKDEKEYIIATLRYDLNTLSSIEYLLEHTPARDMYKALETWKKQKDTKEINENFKENNKRLIYNVNEISDIIHNRFF